jgi:hypothetical protein
VKDPQKSWTEAALKVTTASAELLSVHFERLSIKAGSNTFSLVLHPRLTVIAGLGQLERDSLMGELVGALGSSRTGVHAEIVEDGGRHLAVFRPEGARHRVVDIDTAKDVSDEFAADDGRIDLLHHHGVELRRARRKMRFSATDLSTGTHSAALIRGLADQDQAKLWLAADAVRQSDDDLQRVAEEVGSAPEDAELIDRIEQRHTRLEAAQARNERHRRKTFFVSLACTFLAIPAALFMPPAAFPLLAIALVSVLVSVWFRNTVNRAAKAEDEALAEAHAQSYLGFQIQRVNGLLSSDAHRKELMQAAQAHRGAVEAWRAISGDIQVDWALEHREEIVVTARVRDEMHTLGALSSTGSMPEDDKTSDLARVVLARLVELRTLGNNESFPLVLDDPFVDVEKSTKPALLELLNRADNAPQLIFLTEDEDVASWARLEALTGVLSIVEPQPEHDERPTASREHDEIRL